MKKLLNPYKAVNWSWNQYKANLHTHTRESDGSVFGSQVIDLYKNKGYNILILTDHDIPGYRTVGKGETVFSGQPYINSWDWSIFEGGAYYQAPINSLKRNENTGIVANGMLTVEGCELSGIHHVGSFDNSYTGELGYNIDTAIDKVSSLGGQAMVYHPGEYNLKYSFYRKLYERHRDVLIGMEVINRHRYFDGGTISNRRGDTSDRVLWDSLTKDFSNIYSFLTRPKLWGYSNDDMHVISEVGGNYQFMLMPLLNVKNFRFALEKGHSYFCYEPERTGEAKAPKINNIIVNEDIKTVTIQSNNTDEYTWVVDGESINGTNSLIYNDSIRFFRAELQNAFGTTYTQPFILVPALKLNWINAPLN